MNTDIVLQSAHAALQGTLPFPEIVAQLLETGVEYYHVDYIKLQITFYDSVGSAVTTAINYERLPPVSKDFHLFELKAAILDSQKNGQKFHDFSKRAMMAGIQSYFAFLRGKRVTYFGRTGDSHTEWFPGVQPVKAEQDAAANP